MAGGKERNSVDFKRTHSSPDDRLHVRRPSTAQPLHSAPANLDPGTPSKAEGPGRDRTPAVAGLTWLGERPPHASFGAYVAEGLARKPQARDLLVAAIAALQQVEGSESTAIADEEDDACCKECPVCAIRRVARARAQLLAEPALC